MQNAETVLDVLRERGRRGLPCNELYRQMFNPDLYLLAYGRLYSNHGAMTPGPWGDRGRHVTGQDRAHHRRVASRTLSIQPRQTDLHSEEEWEGRPLGLPSWTDKLVGEVIRLLLGSVLRAAVLRPFTRFPSPPRLPHCAT